MKKWRFYCFGRERDRLFVEHMFGRDFVAVSLGVCKAYRLRTHEFHQKGVGTLTIERR